MRILSILALTLAMRVVAQSASTELDAGSELSTSMISTQSEPSVSDTPTPTISDPGNIETATSTSTTLPPTGTSPPPLGGGATRGVKAARTYLVFVKGVAWTQTLIEP
ncbi:unnamed protein product [Rhizoctonia solani]|uniref:Uncharacterized protein n=1 Tax=Rhizoctonia solani TaxID=456999 RepID=A0A8H3G5K6_9AGAM